jgi:hypothetical protein
MWEWRQPMMILGGMWMRFKKLSFRWLALTVAVLIGLPTAAQAAYFPPGTSASGGIRDLALIYSGYYDPANYGGEDISEWPQSQFKPYVSYLDRQGNRLDTFFEQYLFLGLKAPSGHVYTRAASASAGSDKVDWSWFLDRIFTSGNEQIHALNEETKTAAADLQLTGMRSKVVVMIPFASELVSSFGDVDGDGVSENLTTLAGREKVTHWYIDQVISRFQQGNYDHLDLNGFYWLQEDLDTTKADEVSLVKDTAAYIHAKGYTFSWIPWSGAYASTSWANYGLDFAVLQPNYFMKNAGISQLVDSVNKSSQYGMGVEMEFDGRLQSGDNYRDKFYDYLNGGLQYGYMTGSLLAYYQDVRMVWQLAQDPVFGYPVYQDLYRFVKENYKADSQPVNVLQPFETGTFASTSSASASLDSTTFLQGKQAMRVVFGNYATSLITGDQGTDFAVKDWSAYDSFRIDVYNPQSASGGFTVVVGDSSGRQYYRYVTAQPGAWTTVKIAVSDLMNGTNGSPEEPGTVPIDVHNISYVKLVQRSNSHYLPLPTTFYADNMRLVENGAVLNNLETLTFSSNSSVTLTSVDSPVSERNKALRVDYGLYNVSQTWLLAGQNYYLTDWSGFAALKADVRNPGAAAMNLGIKLTDGAGRTYYKRVTLQPGWNTVQLPLSDVANGANGSPDEGTISALDLTNMQRIDFYQRNNANYSSMSNTLYFDNIRLGAMVP